VQKSIWRRSYTRAKRRAQYRYRKPESYSCNK